MTPPDVDTLPRVRLPFRAILVASRTDPYTSFARFAEFAGYAGHLDTGSGYGPWPDGDRLIALLG